MAGFSSRPLLSGMAMPTCRELTVEVMSSVSPGLDALDSVIFVRSAAPERSSLNTRLISWLIERPKSFPPAVIVTCPLVKSKGVFASMAAPL